MVSWLLDEINTIVCDDGILHSFQWDLAGILSIHDAGSRMTHHCQVVPLRHINEWVQSYMTQNVSLDDINFFMMVYYVKLVNMGNQWSPQEVEPCIQKFHTGIEHTKRGPDHFVKWSLDRDARTLKGIIIFASQFGIH